MKVRRNPLPGLLSAALLLLVSACSLPGRSAETPTVSAGTPGLLGPSLTAPVATLPPLTGQTPSPAASGVLTGTIEYATPASPASSLYATNTSNPQEWYLLELPAADGPQSFSMQVPAGTYQLVARAAGGQMAAALSTAGTALGTVTVDTGQTVSGLLLTVVAPQSPCQGVGVPASPDGRFPAIEAAASCLTPTPQPSATPSPTATLGLPAKPGSLNYQYSCANGIATTIFNWVDLSNNEDGFILTRNDTVVATLPADTTTYTDNAPWSAGETLKYSLVAYNAAGKSSPRTASFSCK